MVQENEVVTLLLGLCTLIFFALQRQRFGSFRAAATFVSGFSVLVAGWLFTILEGFFFAEVFNGAEHLCYAVSAALFTLWSWKCFGARGVGRR